MNNIGLVLEGGGMRGIYSAGVLDYFMDKQLYFPYVIGASAGACNGTSYLSRQQGRNKTVEIEYVNDSRYLGLKTLIKTKSIFGMDFVFGEIPTKLNPFDFQTFFNTPEKFYAVATDCETGKPVYYEKSQCNNEDLLTVIRASSSLPLFSPFVEFDEKKLLDGGITDSIPIKRAISDGYEKCVVVLTRNAGYRKQPHKFTTIIRRKYRNYPNLVEAILNRYKMYNETLDFIEELEKQNKIFVIRPIEPINVSRVEKSKEKLIALYEQGYRESKECFERLSKWIDE